MARRAEEEPGRSRVHGVARGGLRNPPSPAAPARSAAGDSERCTAAAARTAEGGTRRRRAQASRAHEPARCAAAAWRGQALGQWEGHSEQRRTALQATEEDRGRGRKIKAQPEGEIGSGLGEGMRAAVLVFAAACGIALAVAGAMALVTRITGTTNVAHLCTLAWHLEHASILNSTGGAAQLAQRVREAVKALVREGKRRIGPFRSVLLRPCDGFFHRAECSPLPVFERCRYVSLSSECFI
ncbi:hypothetical protein TRVL_07213 [Trypanosoma vivax]|nr:hypothetical protein TRVL_07213 [Trypanosoma vivax]